MASNYVVKHKDKIDDKAYQGKDGGTYQPKSKRKYYFSNNSHQDAKIVMNYELWIVSLIILTSDHWQLITYKNILSSGK